MTWCFYFTTGCATGCATGCKNSTCLIYEIRRTTNSACRVEVRIVYTTLYNLLYSQDELCK